MKKQVCVDLDGVLADYTEGWKGLDVIGDPIEGAKEFIWKLRQEFEVIIFTSRCCEDLQKPEKAPLLRKRIQKWLDDHDIGYDDIYIGQGKPYGVAYVDDRAVPCVPVKNPYAYMDALNRVRELADLAK